MLTQELQDKAALHEDGAGEDQQGYPVKLKSNTREAEILSAP
jgi:hypothetical protein